jgi:SAM-dependent methyltransferase
MSKPSDFDNSPERKSSVKNECLQKEELEFWERHEKHGEEIDLKLARDLPDDTPAFILGMLSNFEKEATDFCFSGAKGRILDAGCGNGNLLLRALINDTDANKSTQYVGMDFSGNMLGRAAFRAAEDSRACFLQGSVTSLPFQDQSFDWVTSSGVLTCLPTPKIAAKAICEFNRVLKPGGILVVDFFNRISHYTLIRRHIFGESINPPEYVSPSEFQKELEKAGFRIISYRGFDFKPCQGYLFMSHWRPLIDPGYVQERFSSFLEGRIVPKQPKLSLLAYRVYVKCIKK